jgi:hypothetical protein
MNPEREISNFKCALYLLVGILLVCMLASFMSAKDGQRECTTITNVEAVFLNEGDTATFLIRQPNGAMVPKNYSGTISFVDDVPEKNKMYAQQYTQISGREKHNAELVIHVHSQKEVQGGEWHNGKGNRNRGKVQRIR